MIKKKKIRIKTILKLLLIIFSIAIFSKINITLQKSETETYKENTLLSARSYAAQSRAGGGGLVAGPGPMDTMYHYVNNGYTFCAAYNWQIARKEQATENSKLFVKGGINGSDQVTQYEEKKQNDLAQSVAFARFYYGRGSDSDIQNLIWASNDWSKHFTGGVSGLVGNNPKTGPYSASNSDIYGRSYKFAEFVYNALDANERLNLQGEPLSDNDEQLKIMVNQIEDTYTVGPYKIEFGGKKYTDGLEHGGYASLGKMVWDEITTNYTGKFVTGKVSALVTFQDNSTQTANIGQIEVLDEDGRVISQNFPEFGKIFYIRYHTTKTAEIVDKINPIIEINYTKKFGSSRSASLAQSITYGSTHVSYTMDRSSSRGPLRCCVDPYYNRHKHYYLAYGGKNSGLNPQLFRWSGASDIVVKLYQKWDGTGTPDPGEDDDEKRYKYYEVLRYDNVSGGVTETEIWSEISKADYDAMGGSQYTIYRTRLYYLLYKNTTG